MLERQLAALCGVSMLALAATATAGPALAGQVPNPMNAPGSVTSGDVLTATANAQQPADSGVAMSSLLPRAPNNSFLAAVSHSTFPNGVLRVGYAVAGDAPPVVFVPSATACSLNSGAGDGGSQVPTSDGGCWNANFGAFAESAPPPLWKRSLQEHRRCGVFASVGRSGLGEARVRVHVQEAPAPGAGHLVVWRKRQLPPGPNRHTDLRRIGHEGYRRG